MDFQKQKQDFLSKKDKSKKGSIDEKMRPIVKRINSFPNYYTTSSCAGRIVLLHQISGKKQESNWIFSSHSTIKVLQLRNALSPKKLPKKGMVWLLAEAPIIHIACKTIDDGWKMVNTLKLGGFKRSSIISSTKSKTTIEAFGNHRIEMPVAEDGKIMVPLSLIKKLCVHSNKKLRQSHDILKRLGKELKK
jgi:tRNA wybutosine-synthesizing protein 3